MDDLLSEHQDELRQAAATKCPLRVPMEDTGEQLHVALQVRSCLPLAPAHLAYLVSAGAAQLSACMLQAVYHRNAQQLVTDWSLGGLQALGTIAHKLGFTDQIVSAVQLSMATYFENGADPFDDDLASSMSLLLWAHRVQYLQLEQQLVKNIAQESQADLSGLGEPLLLKVITELHRLVAEARSG